MLIIATLMLMKVKQNLLVTHNLWLVPGLYGPAC